MAPKMGRMAKSAAKNKSAPKKTVAKGTTKPKSPQKTTEKTPEKKEPVELKEEQKTLQEKMEIEVVSKVKVEPGESASVEKKRLELFCILCQENQQWRFEKSLWALPEFGSLRQTKAGQTLMIPKCLMEKILWEQKIFNPTP